MTWTAHWCWHVKRVCVVIHAQLAVALGLSAQPRTTVLCVTASQDMLETLMWAAPKVG